MPESKTTLSLEDLESILGLAEPRPKAKSRPKRNLKLAKPARPPAARKAIEALRLDRAKAIRTIPGRPERQLFRASLIIATRTHTKCLNCGTTHDSGTIIEAFGEAPDESSSLHPRHPNKMAMTSRPIKSLSCLRHHTQAGAKIEWKVKDKYSSFCSSCIEGVLGAHDILRELGISAESTAPTNTPIWQTPTYKIETLQ